MSGGVKRVRIFGPPGCIHGDAVITINRGGKGWSLPLRDLVERHNGGGPKRWRPSIPTFVQREVGGVVRLGRLAAAWESGIKVTYAVTTATGRAVRATDEHPFLTARGWLRLDEMKVDDEVHVRGEQAAGRARQPKPYYPEVSGLSGHPYAKRRGAVPVHRLAAEAYANGLDYAELVRRIRTGDVTGLWFIDPATHAVHHRDHDHRNNDPVNLAILTHSEHHALHAAEGKVNNVLYKIVTERVESIERHGPEMTYDLEVADDPHNFLASGFVVHNTGKTTRLSRRVVSTVRERGPDSIAIVSFSNTAAEEIASRDGVRGVLPKGAVGTLHSAAYAALADADGGRPAMARDPKIVAGWNDTVGPTWQITGTSRGFESRDRAGSGTPQLDTGDALLEQLDLLRARQVPVGQWSGPVRGFAKAWTRWKNDVGVVDFTDMIVQAWRLAVAGQPMPGERSVLVVDEAQDLTPIEAALTRAWGDNLGPDGRLVYALDDDQAIFDWRGGDPGPVLEVDAEDQVLGRSYRVPPAVHAVAEAWIERCTTRYPKVYLPREPSDRDPSAQHSRGWAYRVGMSLGDPALVDQLETDLADPDDPHATVMVLASCGYMLAPLLKTLRGRGVPFHNPFRPGEGAWNPMTPQLSDGAITTAQRIFRYLVLDDRELGEASRNWTGEDVRAWAELVSVKEACLARGATKLLQALPTGTVPWPHLVSLFRDDDAGRAALQRATAGGPDPRDHLEWLASVILPSKAKMTAYPLQVARSQGSAALNETPRLVVGTVHCSPPDEPVLTSEGYVPIGELTPGVHSLVGYSPVAGLTRGRRGTGQQFVRAVNPYDGPLITMTTARSRTRITPDHRVRVALADSFFGKYVVYLMRRGDWWRIGHCVSGHRPYRSGGVAGRMATERADAGWVLGVFDTKREALIAEITAQARFGVPGTMFEVQTRGQLTSDDLHVAHAAAAGDVGPRAKAVLDAYGLDEGAPLYTRSNRKINRSGGRNLRATFLTEARNLVPLAAHLVVPVAPVDYLESSGKRYPDLLPARITVEHYVGEVHSLEFPPHHHYVSGGAVVHNSTKGAQADRVYLSPDLSGAGARQWRESTAGRDQITRLMYVGMTRAYHRLCLLSPTSTACVTPTDLLPPALEVRR